MASQRCPTGSGKKRLKPTYTASCKKALAARILPFGSNAAIEYAAIMSKRRALGQPILQFDAQIAAIARANGAEAIVTRNVDDFDNLNLNLINPWDAA